MLTIQQETAAMIWYVALGGAVGSVARTSPHYFKGSAP
jgi:hypothetical protein